MCVAEVDIYDYENVYDRIAEQIEGKEIGILSNKIESLIQYSNFHAIFQVILICTPQMENLHLTVLYLLGNLNCR